jgi:hypothetical protein
LTPNYTYKTITAADPLMSLIGSTSRIVDPSYYSCTAVAVD